MRFQRSDRGQALVLVALGMVVLLGFIGMATDVGTLRYEKRLLQTVADSAAIGGASEINYGDVTTGAQAAAVQNGFTTGANGATLTVNNPPLSGPHAGNAAYVEVLATQVNSTYFMKIFGVNTSTVQARAVAYLGTGPACIYALSGTTNIQASCGLIDDSSASQALLNNGSGELTSRSIGVVGGYLNNGSGSISPTPQTGIVPQTDPLAYLSPPSTSACNGVVKIVTTSQTVTPDGNCYDLTIDDSPTVTLDPGPYQQIVTNGTPNVTFNPGLYTIQGGSFTINGGATVTSTAATFYITAGTVTVNGGNPVQMTAPITGSYAGVLFFQSQGDSSAAAVNGDNTTTLTGALYFPSAQLTINGGNSAAAYGILVADTIVFNGSDSFNDDYSSLAGGSPIKAAMLVE